MKDLRVKALGLFILVLLVGAVVAGPAAAAPSSLFTVEPLNKSDCPSGKACFWEGSTYGGNRAFFEEVVGCHSLANIDAHSYYNHFSRSNWFVAFKETPEYYEWILWAGESGSSHVTGAICINHF
jgi:hypothetical protein